MKNHIYIFNWKEGGWNYVHATNIRSARKQAREEWANQEPPVLTIDEDSFRRVTFEEFERILATDGFN